MDSLFGSQEYPVKVLYNSTPPQAHHHSELEFWFVLRGHGQYFVKDRIYDLRPGSGVIIHGNEIHYGISSEDNNIFRAVLIFDPALVENRHSAIASLELIAERSFFSLVQSDSTAVEFLLKEIDDEIKAHRCGWRDIVCCGLERFLLYVVRSPQSQPADSIKPNPVIYSVINHLESAYRNKESIEELGRKFGMSVSALRRQFRNHTGLGIKEFIIRLQVAEAKRILDNSEDKIAVVAYEVGFDNLSAFNRDFRMITGMSPSEYRHLSRT